ncbi:hypothetical protein P3X46_031252 [Hevea brasiliensis]|uniref:Uncharacterized protein n=1 Tax=Hevea brasiliensis TaxID=3981 RepID=A0ABQ9KLK6_HEVBR|nr:hypothetical protein P3X46_031252 [Hevea brasiliensis]
MAKSLKLKLIAIASILITTMVGVCLPLFSTAVPALRPDKNLFSIVKAFASGVILATGYMHVLPDSFNCLTSECLPKILGRTIATLMVDSSAMSYYWKRLNGVAEGGDREKGRNRDGESVNVKVEDQGPNNQDSAPLLRHRVVAQVLELGIVVHSTVIGLSTGASYNPCAIRPLVAALCFHQLFEGMGLGGCILQAEYGLKMNAIMVFLFSATTPLGIVLGIGSSNVYSDNSPTALIVVGALNASSAGLLNYMALVDLLSAEFMGPKLQKSVRLQIQADMAVLLGAGGMSLMAKWA